MRVRSSGSMVRGLAGTLLLGSLLSGDPVVCAVHADSARATRPLQMRGDHLVRAVLGSRGVELALKDGFSLRARGRTGTPGTWLTLRVSPVRAAAGEVDPAFVPIGPTVAVTGEGVRAEVAYRAEAFHVRKGHRLVLAQEQARCDHAAACWALVPAAYEGGRCVARDVVLSDRRLQFGSVPINAAEGPSRSAAP